MVLPEVLLGMTILKNKQHPIIRMHLNMIDMLKRLLVVKHWAYTQHVGDQIKQNLFRNLLGSTVCFSSIAEGTADPNGRRVRRTQARNLSTVFLSADAAMDAIAQRQVGELLFFQFRNQCKNFSTHTSSVQLI